MYVVVYRRIVFFLVKPRRTRKEELQEAARQKAAAALAYRNRLYGGQNTEGRKPVGPRRSRGSSLTKPQSKPGAEQDGKKAAMKPTLTSASNLQEG